MRKPIGITVPYRAAEFNEFERRSKVKQTLIANKREWVGLTDEEINEWSPEIHVVILAIEAKLKEKNT